MKTKRSEVENPGNKRTKIQTFPKEVFNFLFPFFNNTERFTTLAQVCKEWREISLKSIDEFTFSDISVEKLLKTVKNLNLKEITLDLITDLTDDNIGDVLKELENIEQIHIRECNLSVVMTDFTKNLIISLTNIEFVQSNSLESIKFFNCNLNNLDFDTPKLKHLEIFNCELNSRLLENLSEQTSLDELILNECSNLDSVVLYHDKLTNFSLIQCPLKELTIFCPKLDKMKLNWCENLDILKIKTDKIREIDLTGVSKNQNIREANIKKILEFYQKVKIIH